MATLCSVTKNRFVLFKLLHKQHRVFAISHGNQVCVSSKKVIVVDQNGENETRTEKCERTCFKLNETAVLKTKVEEGGRLSQGKFPILCCLWSSTTWLEVSVEKPRYKCLRCEGDRCQDNSTSLTNCAPGQGCFSMVFTIRRDNKTIDYPVKGCTDDAVMYSRGCWNDCRKISVNYDMCIECCYDNSCNKGNKENATMDTTIHAVTEKPNKIQKRSKRNTGVNNKLFPWPLLFLICLARLKCI